MGSLSDQLHFVLFPFMAQGHLIPMVDIGRLLAQRDVIVTIVTTPHNAGRVHKSVARAMESGQPIRLVQLRFPGEEVGLPEGCENIDMVSSGDDWPKFFKAVNLMEEEAMKLFEKLIPRPNCIISDMCLFYTRKIADKFQIPRISFHGYCCFCLLCLHNIYSYNMLETITSNSEYFIVPGMPKKVEFTLAQLPLERKEAWKEISEPWVKAEIASYGVVINTFEELESSFVEQYKKARNDKFWCIGPVSLSHKCELDKTQRGYKASIDEHQYLKWLDFQKPGSVIYACLGSVSSLRTPHLIELGLGIEASNRQFIWVIRGNSTAKEIGKWKRRWI